LCSTCANAVNDYVGAVAVRDATHTLDEPFRREVDHFRARARARSEQKLGDILSAALEVLAQGGSLTTLGYDASRQSTIDVTNLIWRGASIKSFVLLREPTSAWAEAWVKIMDFLKSGHVNPIVAKTFPLEDAAAALRHLVEERPFGRVLLKI
jgi:NADPH:quinone reductase-like Zn-dependent oxidoreductase